MKWVKPRVSFVLCIRKDSPALINVDVQLYVSNVVLGNTELTTLYVTGPGVSINGAVQISQYELSLTCEFI